MRKSNDAMTLVLVVHLLETVIRLIVQQLIHHCGGAIHQSDESIVGRVVGALANCVETNKVPREIIKIKRLAIFKRYITSGTFF